MRDLDLLVSMWIGDVDAIILRKLLQQDDTLVQHTFPSFASRVLQAAFAELLPFVVEHGVSVLLAKVGGKRSFKSTPKQQRSTSVLLGPTVQVAVAVTSRAV